jgi:hypothetical protein
MKNLQDITLDQLSMVQGGGDPVPGAEIYIEQEPNDEPIANDSASTVTAAPASGNYNSSRSNIAS